MTALAERAVACKGWRWMAGMLDLAENGECRIVRATKEASHDGLFLDFTWPNEDGDSDELVLSSEYGPHGNFLPDLDDPATLGCLLALAREAWGDPKLAVMADADGRWRIVGKHDYRGLYGFTTEAEALVAALEDAP